MRVLKPGGHMVVFAGSRTQDLMGLSIRLAGFEIRDSLAWLYGSGFPKSHDVSKAIDKLAGAEREVVGTDSRTANSSWLGTQDGKASTWGIGQWSITSPSTSEAKQWDGWGTALKPGHEPVVLARKPLAEKTVARNVLAHGTGAINIDACRVEAGDLEELQKNWDRTQSANQGIASTGLAQIDLSDRKPSGRWPANVLLDHHAAAWVDEQSGHQKDGVAVRRNGGGRQFGSGLIYSNYNDGKKAPDVGYGGGGGASRLFYSTNVT